MTPHDYLECTIFMNSFGQNKEKGVYITIHHVYLFDRSPNFGVFLLEAALCFPAFSQLSSLFFLV